MVDVLADDRATRDPLPCVAGDARPATTTGDPRPTTHETNIVIFYGL
jgi:hypothetical protein